MAAVLFHTGPHTFRLSQLDTGIANGTTVWLAGRVLAVYLAHVFTRRSHGGAALSGRSAIELGSGTGATALALAALHCDVLATDSALVLSHVLNHNIRSNASLLPSSVTVQARELDWAASPEHWSWDDPVSISRPCEARIASRAGGHQAPLLRPPFDLIVSADTVYSLHALGDLVRTLYTLSLASCKSGRYPPCYICLERRDPSVVDEFFRLAEQAGFSSSRIPSTRLARILNRSDLPKEELGIIEIWKMVLPSSKRDSVSVVQ